MNGLTPLTYYEYQKRIAHVWMNIIRRKATTVRHLQKMSPVMVPEVPLPPEDLVFRIVLYIR